MLDQLSCEATHWERGQFFESISSRAVKWCEYIWNPYLYCGCRYNIFHIISLHGKIWTQQIGLAPNELNKLTSLPMCGFTAQLVEHCTGIAEVTGLNPVEALIFFKLLPSNNLLKLENLLNERLVKLCAKTAICFLTLHWWIYHTLSLIKVLVLF